MSDYRGLFRAPALFADLLGAPRTEAARTYARKKLRSVQGTVNSGDQALKFI
jgi:hypothetical protein